MSADEIARRTSWAKSAKDLNLRRDLLSKPSERVLTDETISLCFDVGTYLGETFIREHKGIAWALYEEPRTPITNYPILSGLKAPVSPFDTVYIFALKVKDASEPTAANPALAAKLKGFYDHWAGHLLGLDG